MTDEAVGDVYALAAATEIEGVKTSGYESTTPALDKVMAEQYSSPEEAPERTLEPEVYYAAALEAYNLMGMALSEVGSMYLLMGSMLDAITPKEEDAGV